MKNASNTATVQIENSNKSNKLVNGAATNPSSKSILKSKTHINQTSNSIENIKASAKSLIGRQATNKTVGSGAGTKMPGLVEEAGPFNEAGGEMADVSPKAISVVFKTPQELEEEENERKAKEAFKTLARILKEAKEQKHKELNEQIEKVEDDYN